MSEKTFVDTNIIIYAHDKKEPVKRKIASAILNSLWESDVKPVISIQVLQELYVNLSRFLTHKETNEILSIYKNWEIIDNTLAIFEKAVSLTQKYELSFWDSSILSAAIIGRAVIIYTEDLNHGQKIEGTTILNLFL